MSFSIDHINNSVFLESSIDQLVEQHMRDYVSSMLDVVLHQLSYDRE